MLGLSSHPESFLVHKGIIIDINSKIGTEDSHPFKSEVCIA